MDFFRKKLLTYKKHFAILSLVAREKIKNPEEMRYAEVSELADEQDEGSCEHCARVGSSPIFRIFYLGNLHLETDAGFFVT